MKSASFASENFAGVHPQIMKALVEANSGHYPSYGNDAFTQEAEMRMKEIFGDDISVYFTFNGTGANNFALGSATDKYSGIYCSDVAHIYVDESTAPEAFTGSRLYPVASKNGKIIAADLKNKIKRVGDIHHPQAKVVTITQPTEYGTVYTPDELKAIKLICTANNLLLHIDGARFFNAAVHLDVSLPELCKMAGADILTLGGTKIGLMFGEAVIFFNSPTGKPFKFMHKRSMQLASKNRFIAVQFQQLLSNNLWHELAAYTNGLAKTFEKAISNIPSIKIAYPVETNMVFLNMSRTLYAQLNQYADFYYWDDEKEEARLVFSFANTVEDVMGFVEFIRACVG